MNNDQFRRLVFDKPDHQNGGSPNAKRDATPSTLGAKRSSFMPMTPRTVKGGIDVDFARQVRERNSALQPAKKFKSSAPKGVKFATGYTDRARARAEADDAGEDEKAERIKALEEQMKLGQIPVETFEALRDEIAGGDVASTHLVKGLDRKLLERVRRGEDVMGVGGDNSGSQLPPDVDEELEKLEDEELETIQREKTLKKGTKAPPPVAGVKRSRNEIMAELKAQRQAAAEAKAAPALDSSKWKKVGEKEKSRIEIDHKGREVLITVDEDGIVKKKVRKVAAKDANEEETAIEMPDASKAVLGADAVIPSQHKPTKEDLEDDDDIFEGVGAEYNPLGDDDEDEDDSSDAESSADENEQKPAKNRPPAKPTVEDSNASKSLEDAEDRPTAPRNYFKDTTSVAEEPIQDRLAGVEDLLKKAAKMDPTRSGNVDDDSDEDNDAKQARLKKRAEMLAQQDRDFEDMDMGFGSSRYDDGEDDGEGGKVKLSEWKDSMTDGKDGREGKEKDGGKNKRKPKKRKGDANNMADIMRVIEGRKGS
jgi:hypothetical protein